MAKKTTVVHCKREPYDVYIGRPGKWGNKFEIGPDGTRGEVVEKYRNWVVDQPELMAALPELKGKTLACWCAPQACHGDVLAELAEAAPELDIMDYEIRICVAGSRSWHDPEQFDLYMQAYVRWIRKKGKKFCFISGDAWRGPDRMIIDWAKAHNVPCFKFPADWDEYGKAAGHIRNAEMRKRLTHLLVYWDGESRGTKEMIENTMKLEHAHILVVLVDPDPEWIERQQKKAASNTQFSTKRFKAKHHGR